MKISKKTIESLNGNFQYWFGDTNANEVSIEKATELNISWVDENGCANRRTIKSLKSEITFDFIMTKINTDKDKIFIDFVKYFNKLISKEGLSAYPTTYGIGVFVAVGLKSNIDEQKTKVEKLLTKLKIKYSTEYSEAGWVFRYKISKSKENIEIIKNLK